MTNEEILIELVQAINSAWVGGNPDDLVAYFGQDMVIVGPGFSHRTVGIDACIAGYAAFVQQAEILDYQESDFTVDVSGATAVVSYAYDIEYVLGGEEHRDTGHDLFVFNRDGDHWYAVWRTLVPAVPEE